MSPQDRYHLVEAYAEGTLGEPEARQLADAIAAGGPEADAVLRELEFSGLLAESLSGASPDEMARAVRARLDAEKTRTAFARSVVQRLDQLPPRRAFRRFLIPVAACLIVAVTASVLFFRRTAPLELGRLLAVSLPDGGAPAVLIRGGTRQTLAPSATLFAGDGLESNGATLRVQYTGEETLLEIQPGSRVTLSREAGKIVRLTSGALTATVAPQPVGQPLRVLTPQAEVTVVGTRFSLWTGATRTRIDVQEGKVRTAGPTGGTAAEVAAGEYADISAGSAAPVVRARRKPACGTFTWRADLNGNDPSEARFEFWIPDSIGPFERVRGVICSTDFHSGRDIYEDTQWRTFAARMKFAMLRHFIARDPATAKGRPLSLSRSGAAPLIDALRTFSEQSGRPEVEHAGLVLTGLAIAGYQALAFGSYLPERTIAVLPNSPYYEEPGSSEFPPDLGRFDVSLLRIPQLHEMAAGRYGFPLASKFVWEGRNRGAPWALCLQHGVDWWQLGDQSFSRAWLEEVIARRLPDEMPSVGPYALRELRVESGWLGRFREVSQRDSEAPRSNRSTRAEDVTVEPFRRGADERTIWLPSETLARAWVQAMQTPPVRK